MAASATFAMKAGVWFRRARLLIVSPDSRANLARRQAEIPLIALFRFPEPALSMVAAAFKASPSDHYTVYRDGSGWHAAAESELGQPTHALVARIQLDRAPGGAARPSRGQVLLTVV